MAAHDRAARGSRCGPASWSISTSVARVAATARASSEQRDRPVGEPGEPARLGRLPEQPGAPLVVGGEPPGPLERGRGGRVRAAVAAAGPRLLQRGRR